MSITLCASFSFVFQCFAFFKTEARIKIEWIEGDITDMKSISQALECVDVVIHTAAVVDFLDQVDKDLVWSVNVEGNF